VIQLPRAQGEKAIFVAGLALSGAGNVEVIVARVSVLVDPRGRHVDAATGGERVGLLVVPLVCRAVRSADEHLEVDPIFWTKTTLG
jgi:hypothetical protein